MCVVRGGKVCGKHPAEPRFAKSKNGRKQKYFCGNSRRHDALVSGVPASVALTRSFCTARGFSSQHPTLTLDDHPVSAVRPSCNTEDLFSPPPPLANCSEPEVDIIGTLNSVITSQRTQSICLIKTDTYVVRCENRVSPSCMVISIGLDITIVHSYSIRRTCIPITNTRVPVTHGFAGDIRIFHNTDISIRYTAVPVKCTDIPIICTVVACTAIPVRYTAVPVRCTDIPIRYTAVPVRCTDIPIICTAVAVRYTDTPIT